MEKSKNDFSDLFEITTKKWCGKKCKHKIDWRTVANIYTDMRNEIIYNCKKCKKPENEFEIGGYCKEHEKFEQIDDIISKIFLP